MELLTRNDLKLIAKSKGLRGYSKLRKAELIEFIRPGKLEEPEIIFVEKPEIIFVDEAEMEERKRKREVSIQQLKKEQWEMERSIRRWNLYWKKKQRAIQKKMERLTHRFELVEKESALDYFTTQHTINGQEGYDPKSFLLAAKPTILTFLKENTDIKLQLAIKCRMAKKDLKTGMVMYSEPHFVSKVEINFQGTDLEDLYTKMLDKILESLATFERSGSGWKFDKVEELHIHTVKYEPLQGSSYIPLPKNLADKKAIINMKNKDSECFKWCVTRALNLVEQNPERITKTLRQQVEKLNWEGLKFPMELSQISHFEKVNKVSVNVFGYEKGIVYPLSVSNAKHSENLHVNLLLISQGKKKHYCIIKNMSRLLSKQISKKKAKKFYCPRCLNSFGGQDLLDKHLELCKNNEAVAVKMPEKGTFINFKNYHKKMDMPFVIYADFESLMISSEVDGVRY